jgi:hypothetical protein
MGEAKRIAGRHGKALEASGPSVAELLNAVSVAISAALERGMPAGQAASIVIAAAADYARAEYGDGYMPALSRVVIGRMGKPLPERRPPAASGS